MRRTTSVILFSVLVTLWPAIRTQIAKAQEPLVRYTFDEESGDAIDSGTPPPANGAFEFNANRTTNTPGGASPFALDMSEPGVESFVNGGDPAKVDTLTSFTLTTWLNLQGVNADTGGSGNVRLLAKQGPGPAFDGISWNLNNPNEGDRTAANFRLGLFVGGDFNFDFAQSDEDVGADNTWTFLAVTYDGALSEDNVEFYWGDEVTSVLELGSVLSMTSGPVASTAGVADFGPGFTDAAPGVDFTAVGFQDDIRVYGEVLGLEQLELVRLENLGDAPPLQPGDSNQDLKFDQVDLVQVQVAAKYLTGQGATWGEGDWNGAPGGEPGNPPAGNGMFDQLDIISALAAAVYLTGPYAAVTPEGAAGDGQTSIGYNTATGEVWVDAPAGKELTSVNIDSASAIFTSDSAQNLGGSFDNDADNNIFKATFGSSFGSLSFGNVAQPGLSRDFVLSDLTVIGSLNGGGDLGNVDLIYVPEPSTLALVILAVMSVSLGCKPHRFTAAKT